MTQEIYQVLFYLAGAVGAGLSGGLIVLLLNNRLSIVRERSFKRERFRSYIEILRRKIESKQPSEFVFNFDLKDVPRFESEALEARSHIRCNRRERYDDACDAYKRVQFSNCGDTQPNAEAKGKLLSLLNEVLNCAK